MKKVYLAKSNRTPLDEVNAVRGFLGKTGYEVVEYIAGPYTDEPLMECDVLVVVPEHLDHHLIGKGLSSQIQKFMTKKQKNKSNNIYIVKEISGEEILVENITSIKVVDEKQWFKHSAVFTLKERKPLSHYLPITKTETA